MKWKFSGHDKTRESKSPEQPRWSLPDYRPARLNEPILRFLSRNFPHCNSIQARQMEAAFGTYHSNPSPENAYFVGLHCLNQYEWEESANWFNLAALRDHSPAKPILGAMFKRGMGTRPDHDSAMYWISKSDGIMSAFLSEDPYKVVQDMSGRRPTKLTVRRQFTDPNDHSTFECFASYPDLKRFIQIHPFDVVGDCSWSVSEWNISSEHEGGGFYSSEALTEVAFNEAHYREIWKIR